MILPIGISWLSLSLAFLSGIVLRELACRFMSFRPENAWQSVDEMLSELENTRLYIEGIEAAGRPVPADLKRITEQSDRLLAVLAWRCSRGVSRRQGRIAKSHMVNVGRGAETSPGR